MAPTSSVDNRPPEGWQHFRVRGVKRSHNPAFRQWQLQAELTLIGPKGNINYVTWIPFPYKWEEGNPLPIGAQIPQFVAACKGMVSMPANASFDDELDPVGKEFEGRVEHYLSDPKKSARPNEPRWKLKEFRPVSASPSAAASPAESAPASASPSQAAAPVESKASQTDVLLIRQGLIFLYGEAAAPAKWNELVVKVTGTTKATTELTAAEAEKVLQRLEGIADAMDKQLPKPA